MANDPSDPRSSDQPKTTKPADTPAPKAVPPGDWLYSDPDAPLPPAEPPLEVIPLGGPTSPEPPHISRNPRVDSLDPADALADLPPSNPAYPASGWLDADAGVEPAAPGSDDGTSDVYPDVAGPRSGSDVIRGLSSDEFELPADHSSIFDLDATSARFADSSEETDDDVVPVPADSSELPPSEQPSGELFSDSGPSVLPGSDVNVGNPKSGLVGPGSDYPPMGRGASLFDDPDMRAGSGVNLSDPEWQPESTTGPGSSIFDSRPDEDPTPRIPVPSDRGGPDSAGSEVVLDNPEAAGPEIASNIFQRGSGPAPDPGQVSFELPGGKYGKPDSHDSGRIDWSLPQDDTDVSNLLSSDAAREQGIPDDLASLRDEENPDDSLFGAAARRTARRPKSHPPVDDTAGIVIGVPGSMEKPRAPTTRAATAGSWHDRPSTIVEPAPRGGGARGWLGGGALGLLFGVAACAVAYFAGVVPNAGDQKGKMSALEVSLDLVKKDAESQVAAEKKKSQTVKDTADRAESARLAAVNDLKQQTTKLKTAETERKKLAADVVAEKKKVTDAEAAVAAANTKFQEDGKKLMDEFTQKVADARKAADEQTKLATDAAARADAAAKKLKTADDALTGLVAALKASKLVDEKDDVATAVAKAPDALKRAGAAATSTDATKAAEALLAARKDLDAARAEAVSLKTKAAEAETAAAKARTEAEKTVAAAKAETDVKVKDAVATLTAKNDTLAADLRKAEAEFRQKLAAKDEEMARQLADARAGRAVALTSVELRSKERAADLFAAGASAFAAGRHAAAEATLEEATRLDGSDARLWYFLGLAQHAQGKVADAAFKKGGDLEARGMPNSREVGLALEGVYGPGRRALQAHRP